MADRYGDKRPTRHDSGYIISRLIAVALAAFLFELLDPVIDRAAVAPAIPNLAKSACAVSLPRDERIDCYLLTVPENRTRAGSNLIHLPVIVFRSRSAAPRPDPIIFTAGGPGASSLVLFILAKPFACWTSVISSCSNSEVQNTRNQASIAPRSTRSTKALFCLVSACRPMKPRSSMRPECVFIV